MAVLLGAVRFWQLGGWSLWLDEALTFTDSRQVVARDNPLGYYLLGGFYSLWEGRPDEFALRLPAAVCGWASIPLVWWSLAPFLGRAPATLAALVLATSSWHLYWSQNARFYTLALGLALLGGGLFLRGLQASSPLRLCAGLLVSAAAALAHPSAAILFGALLVAPWLARAAGTGDTAPRPWRLLVVLTVVLALVGSGWAHEVWWKWSYKTGSGSLRHFVLASGFLLTPFLGVGILVGCLHAARRPTFFGVLLTTVPLLGLSAALAASLFVRVSAQYVFVLLPWVVALAAAPWASLTGEDGSRPRPVLAALYALLLTLPGAVDSTLYFTVRNGDRPKWREAYIHVFESLEPGDLILGMEAPVGEFYLDPLATDLRDWRRVAWLDRFRAGLPGDWARYPRRTWFVVNLEQLEDWARADKRELMATLEGECRRTASFPVPWTPRDLDVHVYLRDPWSSRE